VHDDKTPKFEVSRTEKVLDAGAIAASFAPWLGGPISGVLSGMSQSRKFDRAAEMPSSSYPMVESARGRASEHVQGSP